MPKEDTQWKPGQSGNPAGRPKGRKSFPDALRRFSSMTPRELKEQCAKPLDERDDITVLEAWAMLTAKEASEGNNLAARNLALDRSEGKPKQTLDISGDPKKIEFEIVESPGGAASDSDQGGAQLGKNAGHAEPQGGQPGDDSQGG